MVDLREFIKESLTQIVYGVADAQKAIARDTNAVIVPHGAYIGSDLSKTSVISQDQLARFVEFDVAVTVSESVQSGGKISVLSIASVGGDLGHQSSSVSRIKFSVPIVLQGQTHRGV